MTTATLRCPRCGEELAIQLTERRVGREVLVQFDMSIVRTHVHSTGGPDDRTEAAPDSEQRDETGREEETPRRRRDLPVIPRDDLRITEAYVVEGRIPHASTLGPSTDTLLPETREDR